jgi:hypothetical protein
MSFEDLLNQTPRASEDTEMILDPTEGSSGSPTESTDGVEPKALTIAPDIITSQDTARDSTRGYLFASELYHVYDCLTSIFTVEKAHDLKFEKFLELPPELRERMYESVLYTGQPIRPRLCNRRHDGAINFHDDSQHSRLNQNHGAISNLLGITRVSKKIRAESLPFFYSTNTFAVIADTPTYFAHLQNLDRFHLIRHVRFGINMLHQKWAPQYLEQMTTYLKNTEDYERTHTPPPSSCVTRSIRKSNDHNAYNDLVNHPRYNVGGLNEMALFICIRMLTSTFHTPSSHTSSLVLPIPSSQIFTSYASLRWFPSVCHGLGIHLRVLEGHELSYNHQGVIGIVWHQKFQKKDFEMKIEGIGNEGGEVRKRALEMFPDLDDRVVQKRCSYMRTSCDGERYTWFEVRH